MCLSNGKNLCFNKRNRITTRAPFTTKSTTTEKEPQTFTSHFYPQLAQDHTHDHSHVKKKQHIDFLRPNFNNEEDPNVTRFDPLAALFSDQFTTATAHGGKHIGF